MTDLETTPIVPTETLQAPQVTRTVDVTATPILPVQPESTVRNPDKLLELFNAQKAELAEYKKYKTTRESELGVIEQDRLKKEQQYEALIPLKIEEALKPYLEKVALYETDKVNLSNKLLEAQSKYQMLQDSLNVSSMKDSLYTEFVAAKGDPSTSKEALWKLYGADIKVDKDGKPTELPELMKTIQADSFGSRLFIATVPSGTGTTPQTTKAGSAKTESDKPRSVTQAMLLSPRKHGITMADIGSGKIIVEG